MRRITSEDGSLEIELGEVLGRGRDGVCYRVAGNSLGFPDMALKLMTVDERGLRVLGHIEGIVSSKRKRSLCKVQSLECLLVTPFIADSGECCLLMPRAHGTLLSDEHSLRGIAECSLGHRLQIACQIAVGVERLHDVRIIHADIAGPNIVIDLANMNAFIIDVDGGGVAGSLAPRIRGHHDEWIAPELQGKKPKPAGLASDRWSLAMVLHEVITGMPPFYFCHILAERTRYADNWPPIAEDVPSEFGQQTRQHRETIERICDVAELFRRAFGRGQIKPRMRPTASEWVQCLAKHLWVSPHRGRECRSCGTISNPELIYCQNDECQAIIHRCLCICNECREMIPINSPFCPKCGRKQPD